MWIATTRGFFSVVRNRDSRMRGALVVRARVRGDLLAVVSERRIVATPDADYPYRAFVRADEWAAFLDTEARSIDYPNFKAAVQERQGVRRSAVYHSVWTDLQGLELL